MKLEEIASEVVTELESIGVEFGGRKDRAHLMIKRRLRAAYSEGVTDAYDAHAYVLTPRT